MFVFGARAPIISLLFCVFGEGVKVGDLTVMKAAGFLFVSFHGDTGGMATADVLRTVHRVQAAEHKECRVIMGIDANSYPETVCKSVTSTTPSSRCNVQ